MRLNSLPTVVSAHIKCLTYRWVFLLFLNKEPPTPPSVVPGDQEGISVLHHAKTPL